MCLLKNLSHILVLQVEFYFALLKIFFIVFLIILGLVISLGGVPGVPRLGFHYWKTPGALVEYIGTGSWGQFLGYWAVMSNAVFSFAGVESIAMAAAETHNPRIAIPKAPARGLSTPMTTSSNAAPFKPSSQVPRLSALFAKNNVGGDLEQATALFVVSRHLDILLPTCDSSHELAH